MDAEEEEEEEGPLSHPLFLYTRNSSFPHSPPFVFLLFSFGGKNRGRENKNLAQTKSFFEISHRGVFLFSGHHPCTCILFLIVTPWGGIGTSFKNRDFFFGQCMETGIDHFLKSITSFRAQRYKICGLQCFCQIICGLAEAEKRAALSSSSSLSLAAASKPAFKPSPFSPSRESVFYPPPSLSFHPKKAPKKPLFPCFSITRFFRGSKERAAPRATYFLQPNATRTNRRERNQPRKKVFLWKSEFC